MKILLTGGNGFIGKHLLSELGNFEYKVVSLKSNILDELTLRKEIENIDFDVVVHLAGLSHVTSHSPSLIYETNVIGSQNLISAIEKNFESKRIFIASTCHIYASSNNPISETFLFNPKSHYAASKLAMEFICKNTASRNIIVSLRLFNSIGMGQKKNFFTPKIFDAHMKKKPVIRLGNIEIQREFNDVRWTAAVVRSLVQVNAPSGDYNICSGEAHKASEILSLISEKTEHFPKIVTDVKFLRPDEQNIIFGDPSKTSEILNQNGVQLHRPSINETIEHMITAYKTQFNAKTNS